MTVYYIQTKFGTKICLYTSLMCAKISKQLNNTFVFMVAFVSVQKERKNKSEEIKPGFEDSYLRNALGDFAQIWYVDY